MNWLVQGRFTKTSIVNIPRKLPNLNIVLYIVTVQNSHKQTLNFNDIHGAFTTTVLIF